MRAPPHKKDTPGTGSPNSLFILIFVPIIILLIFKLIYLPCPAHPSYSCVCVRYSKKRLRNINMFYYFQLPMEQEAVDMDSFRTDDQAEAGAPSSPPAAAAKFATDAAEAVEAAKKDKETEERLKTPAAGYI
jgi:hypothetical protein